jgi:chromosome partitioning protein
MKTLVLANEKGGVGKSAIACQLSYFIHDLLKKRVLVIDLDHQGNSTRSLTKSGLATVASVHSHQLLTEPIASIAPGSFVLVPSNRELLKLQEQKEHHNEFATNLQAFLHSIGASFDVAIIDTNPNPDIRVIAALVVGDYVLAPIQLNQEAIHGIAALRKQIVKIQHTLNTHLRFIGILPNLVEPTPFQRDNMKQLVTACAELFITRQDGHLAAFSRRTAWPEAQALGIPIWKSQKTSSKDVWPDIRPVFETVVAKMEVSS